jgi:predicted DNA-binding transcriptional regulator AlpA
MAYTYIEMRAVCEIVDLSAKAITNLVVKQQFPTPVKSASGQISWIKQEVQKWKQPRRRG